MVKVTERSISSEMSPLGDEIGHSPIPTHDVA